MTEKLEHIVLDINGTPLFDNRQVTEIIKSGNSAAGVVVLDKATDRLESFYAKNIICATGAPACIYENSVYPQSQHGMTGVLIDAGVRMCNYSQWQYGMASVDFRWNVSGSFMQVIPRFVSVDNDGIEYEFLNGYFNTGSEMFDNIFLKGYQWPFSFERAEKSSRIDIAVHNEIRKGRKVYLDYTRNPEGFSYDMLGDEAAEYLGRNNVTAALPIDRLAQLNSKAIDVYTRQNIDLYKEKLRIAVCAQHNNGGVYTDNNYETDVKGLYVIGEAAGTFGLARPGGTALNDTQVGGLLCAKHISRKISTQEYVLPEYDAVGKYESFVKDDSVDYSFIPSVMSESAAFIRNYEECAQLLSKVKGILDNYPLSHKSLSRYFYDRDMLVSAKALLETLTAEMSVTGSRGGAVFVKDGVTVPENTDYRKYITLTENGQVSFVQAKPVPEMNEPFEKYLNKI